MNKHQLPVLSLLCLSFGSRSIFFACHFCPGPIPFVFFAGCVFIVACSLRFFVGSSICWIVDLLESGGVAFSTLNEALGSEFQVQGSVFYRSGLRFRF